MSREPDEPKPEDRSHAHLDTPERDEKEFHPWRLLGVLVVVLVVLAGVAAVINGVVLGW
jgi:hypothetical protein